jgi:hypothetical protein
MGMSQVSIAAATAVLGYDLMTGDTGKVQGNKRILRSIACTGSAAAGDSKIDLMVDNFKVGSFFNLATGFPTLDHRFKLNNWVPVGSAISLIVVDAPATNPLNVQIEWDDL